MHRTLYYYINQIHCFYVDNDKFNIITYIEIIILKHLCLWLSWYRYSSVANQKQRTIPSYRPVLGFTGNNIRSTFSTSLVISWRIFFVLLDETAFNKQTLLQSCLVLPVSLDWPFLIAPSVFSHVYFVSSIPLCYGRESNSDFNGDTYWLDR